MTKSIIHERVERARAGTNPTVICKMPSGWAVLGDFQLLPGYTILLHDPVVPSLNSLNEKERTRYLLDMTIIGDALMEVTGAYRINYEILGNTDPFLHAHVFPRYMSEPEHLRRIPAWAYQTQDPPPKMFDVVRDKALMEKIAKAIGKRI
jgi:diadenosine tetraphosphate (Ap4A) HIT family hydrolase